MINLYINNYICEYIILQSCFAIAEFEIPILDIVGRMSVVLFLAHDIRLIFGA